ncbi:MAG: AraC family transcriptional regulator [Geobacter sp.]|nr:MAG: AraC family transcriptional regulator [Geobacter sp.]
MKPSLLSPFTEVLPTPLVLRTVLMPKGAMFPEHAHAGGEFVYSLNGIVQVIVGDERYLVPPQYGLWLPPNVKHVGVNRREVLLSSLYVSDVLCNTLPTKPQALMVSPFMRSLLDHARESKLDHASDRYLRLLTVFLDELTETPQAGTYIPASDDAVLSKVLHYLEKNPRDNRSVAELARQAGITERTLARKCRQELGMPLTEWRNRMRVVNAISMIEDGKSVESIASQFGYSTASAFIVMFKNLTGTTPASYRQSS